MTSGRLRRFVWRCICSAVFEASMIALFPVPNLFHRGI